MITTEIIILSIALAISLLFNLFLLIKNSFNDKPVITFEESFSILNSVIEMQRTRFFAGLNALSRKHTTLSIDGKQSPPNNSNSQYVKDKKDLKINISKKVVHSLTKEVRKKILVYYTDRGLIDYIIHELDKDLGNE